MKLKITVDGKLYEAEVEVSESEGQGPSYYPPLHANIPAAPPPTPGPAAPKGPTAPSGPEGEVCRSPLAGTVTRIDAEVGQAIEVNAPLLALEAMKMETAITAPFAGTVKAINAAVGDAVQQGQVLVEIE